MIMKERKSKSLPGAGIVLLQCRDNEIHVLGLFKDGDFDLPKGLRQKNETDLECAKRECKEESSITKIDFFENVKPIKLKQLTLFILKHMNLNMNTQNGFHLNRLHFMLYLI